MYKVLLADDDETVLEGITHLVDWEALGTQLMATATSGHMAYDFIKKKLPDIVISDIKMPGMSGLELIEKASGFNSSFIILSGHEEFDFAKTAMQYGVKHYLLKPSNEQKITSVLREVVQELDEKRSQERYIQKIVADFEKVKPQIGEQFLKEFITGKTRDTTKWDYLCQLLEIEMQIDKFRLILCEIGGTYDFAHVFSLKNMLTGVLSRQRKIHFSTTIGERVAVLIEDVRLRDLTVWLTEVKQLFQQYHRLDMTIGISRADDVENLHALFKQAKGYLEDRFYLENSSIVTPESVPEGELVCDLQFDHEQLAMAMRSGDLREVDTYLNRFFEKLRRSKVDVNLVKAHALEVYWTIIRQMNKKAMDNALKEAVSFERFDTLSAMRTFVIAKAWEVTKVISESLHRTKSTIVQQMLVYMEQHYDDETLSLSKLASDVFYMNADYLGKLFKRETGYKFSAYLVKIRIDQAKTLIEQQVKVFQVAEAVGFGNNPQYFSKVFKRMTGYTPSEYKKTI